MCSANDDPTTYDIEPTHEESTMEPTSQPTCAARLPGHLSSRLEDIRAMLGRDDYAMDDEELPSLYDYVLGSQVMYAIKVELSTGGPADYVTATVDGSGDVQSIYYHFADWFDHAEQRVTGDDFETLAEWLGALFDLSSLSMYVDR